MRRCLFGALAALAVVVLPARADLPPVIKIGVLNDLNGPFADESGKGAIVAAQMAADDFAAEGGAQKVEIISGDHQNKADIGSALAREWVDSQNVSAIADVPNSSVGLAVNDVMRQRNRVFIASSVGTSDLTGKFCSPSTLHWTLDTWALGSSAARSLMKLGGDTWFFISFDYALGAALERDATTTLTKLGGKVLGSVRHPLGTTDFSTYLLQAQSSGAKVVALGDTGSDFINAVKQAAEFGITKQQKLVGLFTQIVGVDAAGLQVAQGMLLTEAFYWDLNDKTRAFAKRFSEKMPGRVPTENQAGVYASVLAYLRAVKAANTVDGDKVMAELRRKPTEDDLFGHVVVRADGRAVHDMHQFQVKSPAELKSRWDVYKLVATIPGEEAFRPLDLGGCKLVSP